jgi:hypothetical protein
LGQDKIGTTVCPLPGCSSQKSVFEVRYGSREIDCDGCGRFKISDELYQAARIELAGDAVAVDGLRRFIRARNAEGKIPVVTAENWRVLAADA